MPKITNTQVVERRAAYEERRAQADIGRDRTKEYEQRKKTRVNYGKQGRYNPYLGRWEAAKS